MIGMIKQNAIMQWQNAWNDKTKCRMVWQNAIMQWQNAWNGITTCFEWCEVCNDKMLGMVKQNAFNGMTKCKYAMTKCLEWYDKMLFSFIGMRAGQSSILSHPRFLQINDHDDDVGLERKGPNEPLETEVCSHKKGWERKVKDLQFLKFHDKGSVKIVASSKCQLIGF